MEKGKGSTKITYKFPNGSTFTGTMNELKEVAKSLGQTLSSIGGTPRGFYKSGSSGLIEIKSMHAHHIRRALIKTTRESLGKVFKPTDTNGEFLTKYNRFGTSHLIEDLKNELVARGNSDTPRTTAAKKKTAKAAVAKTSAAKSPAPKKATVIKAEIKKPVLVTRGRK